MAISFTEIVQVPVQTIGQLQKVAIVPQTTGPVKKVSEIIPAKLYYPSYPMINRKSNGF